MPRKQRTPSPRRQARWNCAVVTLNGKDYSLDPRPPGQENPSSEVSSIDHRLIAEWEARGRRPEGHTNGGSSNGSSAPPGVAEGVSASPADLTSTS
jgi:hypothetical protein